MAFKDRSGFVQHEIDWDAEKISNIWGYYSQSPSIRKQFFGYNAGGKVAKYIYEKINIKEVETVLDFGCGNGDLIKAILETKKFRARVYGLDFSNDCVKNAERNLSGEDFFEGVEWVQRLPSKYADNFFDLVIATEVIEHIKEQQLDEMLKECMRIMRYRGYLVLTTPNNENLNKNKVICPECGCIFHRWQHVKSWNEQSIAEKMAQHNFAAVEISTLSWGSLSLKGKILNVVKRKKRQGKTLLYIGRKI